jgi:hypothetical protein
MANLGNITINVSLNGPLDVEKLAEEFKASIRKEVERVGVKFEVANPEYHKVTDRAPKFGDFVKYSYSPHGFIKVGKYYEIDEIDDGELFHIDEDGDAVPPDSDERFEVYERIAPCCEKSAPLKVGDYAKVIQTGHCNEGKIVEILNVDYSEYYPFDTKLLNGEEGDCHRLEQLVRATDEVVAEAKAKLAQKELAEKWAKIGREPNEFKEGDFVKYKKCFAEVTRVGIYDISIEAPNGIIPIAFESATLVTPVEARFDR